jgi:hypothetical protein
VIADQSYLPNARDWALPTANEHERSNSAGHASVVLPPPGRGAFPETIARARSYLSGLPRRRPSGRLLLPLTPRQATPLGMVGPLGVALLLGIEPAHAPHQEVLWCYLSEPPEVRDGPCNRVLERHVAKNDDFERLCRCNVV